jgi:hypothetical protein
LNFITSHIIYANMTPTTPDNIIIDNTVYPIDLNGNICKCEYGIYNTDCKYNQEIIKTRHISTQTDYNPTYFYKYFIIFKSYIQRFISFVRMIKSN